MSRLTPPPVTVDGATFSIGIVAACYNPGLVDALLEAVRRQLADAGVQSGHLTVLRVPGSHEVPWAAQLLARRRGCHCVIGLGVLIAGSTNHHEMVGQSVSLSLQQVALATGTPVINGVIVANTLKQARDRCIGPINRGAEFARAALAMAALKRTHGGRS